MKCYQSEAGEKRMEEKIKEIESSTERKRLARLEDMRAGQRTLEEIMQDLLALKDDFSVEAQKKEAELFAEKRKLSILKTL